MQRVFAVAALLTAALPCFASDPVPRDPDHIRRYEIAVRHHIKVRRLPSRAVVYVGINGAPAPPELIARFPDSRPRVRAWVPGRHKYVCAMMLGADYGDECYLVVWGYRDHVLHHYHFKRSDGDWQLLSDKVATVE